MKTNQSIRELCLKHTDLNEEDIIRLQNLANFLNIIADLVKADVFIDCLTRDPNIAIVVAEAKPSIYPSMYKHSVVGELALRENEPAALRTLETGMITRDLKAITQESANVKQNVVPIKNKVNKTIGVLIMEQDITEDIKHDRNMEILSETTQQLTETLLFFKEIDYENNITYHLNDAIIVFNGKGIAIYSNPVANKLYKNLGYKDDVIGMHFNNLVLNESTFNSVINGEKSKIFEVNVGNLALQVKYAIINNKDEINGLTMLIKDITEIKEKEKELILKSFAIREIHHRVKNNLQTVASIIRLQSRRIDDEAVKKYFEESINRILSIAVTHEILAQNGVDDVDIKTIIEKLKEYVVKYNMIPNKQIDIEIKGDSIYINSDKATSIALVVNELLQNSLQYAFVGEREGKVEVNIQKGLMYSNISVIDNGIGFDLNSIKPESLGLNIVKSIVKDKLMGNLNIISAENGTRIEFDFKNDFKNE